MNLRDVSVACSQPGGVHRAFDDRPTTCPPCTTTCLPAYITRLLSGRSDLRSRHHADNRTHRNVMQHANNRHQRDIHLLY